MKKIYLLALAGFSFASMNAQTVFSTNFENWTATMPDDFDGSKGNMTGNVTQITTGAVYGSNTAQLDNATTSHTKIATTDLTVEKDSVYEVTFWAKGQGEIRTGLYDGELTSGDFGFIYSPYISINSPTVWESHTQTISADTATSIAQFLLSVKNTVATGHLEIDSVVISKAPYVVPTFTSIYDIQYTIDVSGDSPLVGTNVSTGGIVTAVHANGAFNMSSGTGAWSGVYVYTTQNTVAEGDSVNFTAEVQEYQGLTELAYPTDFNNVSSGNFFMSNSITTAEANTEDYEGCLVTTTNANCTTNGSWWTIDDGSGEVGVSKFLYSYTPAIGTSYDVTGIVEYYLSFKILPRYANDISVSTGINETTTLLTSVYPNPANEFVNIEAPANSTVTILSIEGKVVLSTITKNTIEMMDVASLESGSYIVSISNNNANSTQILIKK